MILGVVCAGLAGARCFSEREVADEIEFVEGSHVFFKHECLKINSAFAYFLNDIDFLFGYVPLSGKFVDGRKLFEEVTFRVFDDVFVADEFSVVSVNGDGFVDNAHGATGGIHKWCGQGTDFVGFLFFSDSLGTCPRPRSQTAFKGRIDFDGAIPVRICEEAGNIAKIHDGEVCLSLGFA